MYICEVSLLDDIHLIDEAFAVAEFLDDEKYIADIDIDATLQVVVEVDVTAKRLPVTVESQADKLTA